MSVAIAKLVGVLGGAPSDWGVYEDEDRRWRAWARVNRGRLVAVGSRVTRQEALRALERLLRVEVRERRRRLAWGMLAAVFSTIVGAGALAGLLLPL